MHAEVNKHATTAQIHPTVGQKIEIPMNFVGYNPAGLFARHAPQAYSMQPIVTPTMQMTDNSIKAGPLSNGLSMLELVKLHNLKNGTTICQRRQVDRLTQVSRDLVSQILKRRRTDDQK